MYGLVKNAGMDKRREYRYVGKERVIATQRDGSTLLAGGIALRDMVTEMTHRPAWLAEDQETA